MNCASPPQNATKGKKMVGESGPPHQRAIQVAVIHVEPANPARPSAAGGAMGCRKMATCGVWPAVSRRWKVVLSVVVAMWPEDLGKAGNFMVPDSTLKRLRS